MKTIRNEKTGKLEILVEVNKQAAFFVENVFSKNAGASSMIDKMCRILVDSAMRITFVSMVAVGRGEKEATEIGDRLQKIFDDFNAAVRKEHKAAGDWLVKSRKEEDKKKKKSGD